MKLAEIFCDNMILQRGDHTCVFGTGDGCGCIEFLNNKIDFQTINGEFSVTLPHLEAWETFDMKISIGNDSITICNILVGDVYLAGGQSNMELSLKDAEQVGLCDIPDVRCYKVMAPDDIEEPYTNWKPFCGDLLDFSAVAYYFSQRLFSETNVPIGILACNRGASRIHSWVPEEVSKKDVFKKSLAIHNPKEELYTFNLDNYLYRNKLLSVAPYTVKAVLWYQGESNTVIGEAENYCGMFKELVSHWRSLWGYDMPFYTVQLMPHLAYPFFSDWAMVRAQQELASKTIPDVYMTTYFDTGEADNIHPLKKKCVGTALANAVLNTLFGRTEIEYSGPILTEWKKEGNSATLTFSHAKGMKLDFTWFSETHIYDKDGIHYEVNDRTAFGKIEGNKLIITWDDEIDPVGVKMNYWNCPSPKIINDSGYFASPFDVKF